MMLAGCNTSYNYFQDERAEAEDRDTSVFGAVLTMSGVIPPQQRPIEYRPRAPIAMPKSADLPAPGAGSAVEQAVNFPEDQDSAEARRRSALRGTLAGPDVVNDGVRQSPNVNLTPETMQAGRRDGGGLRRRGVELNGDPFGNKTANLTRKELSVVVRAPRAGGEILEDGGKPAPRKYLIQPPTTYRTPAETAPLPEKGDIENSKWANKRLYGIKDKTPRRLQE